MKSIPCYKLCFAVPKRMVVLDVATHLCHFGGVVKNHVPSLYVGMDTYVKCRARGLEAYFETS